MKNLLSEDFIRLVTRRRKVDGIVVDAVKDQLLADPLASIAELQERTNNRLLRSDLVEGVVERIARSDANIIAALDQIPSSFLIVSISREIQKGEAHYKEEALMEQMLGELSDIKAKRAGITDKQKSEMTVSDPTVMKDLVTPGFPIKNISSKLRLLIFCLSLYYWGVPYRRVFHRR